MIKKWVIMPNQDYGRGGTLDKYEYKIRAEEIKTLISQKKYVDAAKVADTIDWTRVKSVMMLVPSVICIR